MNSDDPDFPRLVGNYYPDGRTAENPEDFQKALEEFKHSDKAMVIDLHIFAAGDVYSMIPVGGG